MSESFTVSMKSDIDSTLNEGALSYEWLQLLLFGAMAFLGWFLCSQAFDQISKQRKTKKEVQSSKVDDSESFGKFIADYAEKHSVKSAMKNLGLTRAQVQKYMESTDSQEEEATEELMAENEDAPEHEDSAKKKKKKQRSKKAQKASDEPENEALKEAEEVAEVVEAAEVSEDEIPCDIVCARDFETSDMELGAWITAGQKRFKENQQTKTGADIEERKSSEQKFDWYEESKDMEPAFFNASKKPVGKQTPKPASPEKTKITINDVTSNQEVNDDAQAKKPLASQDATLMAKGKGKVGKSQKGKSSGKGAKSQEEKDSAADASVLEKPKSPKSEATKTEASAKKTPSAEAPKGEAPKALKMEAKTAEGPTADAPLAAWAIEGLTWAERMRLANPEVEPEEEPQRDQPAPQQQPPVNEKQERAQRKKRQRRQQETSEEKHAGTKPVVVPPPAKKAAGAPGWEWDMSDGCSAEPAVSEQLCASGWQWDATEQAPVVVPPQPVKIPGVAPGWQWDTTEEFPHPDPTTGSMPIVVPPRRQESRSMMLGIVVNWGSKGFGFLGDQMGNRFYAKQEVVRGQGKLRIGSFVWFRLYDNNDSRVAEIAKLEDHHEWAVKKAMNDGTAWCRLRCEIDGDMTILSEEEAGFPGMFLNQLVPSDDLNWDVDLIEVANEAKAALGDQAAAVPGWLDAAYMASTAAPDYISATTMHGAPDDFWPTYDAEAESNEQWDMVPIDSEMPYEGWDEEQLHVEDSAVLCEDLQPNLGAYLDESDSDEGQ